MEGPGLTGHPRASEDKRKPRLRARANVRERSESPADHIGFLPLGGSAQAGRRHPRSSYETWSRRLFTPRLFGYNVAVGIAPSSRRWISRNRIAT
jgi:hypothetical protein